MKTTNYQKFNFVDVLRNNTINYSGVHNTLITACPDIYQLLINLLNDKDLSSSLRTKVFTAIGYFLIPQDLFSEDEFGAIGYIDDIMLAMFVIYQATTEIGDENVKALFNKGDASYNSIFKSTAYNDAQREYLELFNEVLLYVGFN